MSARVETTYTYQAECLSCAWWGKSRSTDGDAEDDAFEHNVQEHLPDPVSAESGSEQ